MNKKINIGNWEVFWLLINAICAKSYLSFQRGVMEDVGTAGWILTIIETTLALLCFIIIFRLYSGFEGKDLMDIGEHIGGKIGKIVVGLIILLFLLFIVSDILREFAEDMKIISLPVSPISFVIAFFITGMVVAAYFGIETISGLAGIIVVFIGIAYTLILLGVIPYYDLKNLTPIFGNGLNTVLVKSLPRLSMFSEFVYLFLLVPFIKSFRNFKKVGLKVLMISGLFLLTGTLSFTAVYSYPAGNEITLPFFNMSRLISFGRFFERIESFFIISWAAAAFVYLSNGFFFVTYIFKKTFDLQYHKPLILPLAVAVYALCFIPQNLEDAFNLEIQFFRNWSWIVTFGMTILLLVIARFVKKGEREKAAKS